MEWHKITHTLPGFHSKRLYQHSFRFFQLVLRPFNSSHCLNSRINTQSTDIPLQGPLCHGVTHESQGICVFSADGGPAAADIQRNYNSVTFSQLLLSPRCSPLNHLNHLIKNKRNYNRHVGHVRMANGRKRRCRYGVNDINECLKRSWHVQYTSLHNLPKLSFFLFLISLPS